MPTLVESAIIVRDVHRCSENEGRGGGGVLRGRALCHTRTEARTMAKSKGHVAVEVGGRRLAPRHHEPGAAGARAGARATCVGATDAAAEERAPIHFADFPFDVTAKYVIQHRLDEAYPPRSLLHDPRVEGVPDARADADPISDLADPSGEALAHAVRTRSAAHEQRAAEDEVQLFDKEAAHERLAQVATDHFAATPAPKESDIIVGFLYRCRAGDSVLKIV